MPKTNKQLVDNLRQTDYETGHAVSRGWHEGDKVHKDMYLKIVNLRNICANELLAKLDARIAKMKSEGADPANVRELEAKAKQIRDRLRAEKDEDSHAGNGDRPDPGDDAGTKSDDHHESLDDHHEGDGSKDSGLGSKARARPHRR